MLEGRSRAAKPETSQSKAKASHLPQGDTSPAAGLQFPPPQAIRTFPSCSGERAAPAKGGHEDNPRLVRGQRVMPVGAWGQGRLVAVRQGVELFLP